MTSGADGKEVVRVRDTRARNTAGSITIGVTACLCLAVIGLGTGIGAMLVGGGDDARIVYAAQPPPSPGAPPHPPPPSPSPYPPGTVVDYSPPPPQQPPPSPSPLPPLPPSHPVTPQAPPPPPPCPPPLPFRPPPSPDIPAGASIVSITLTIQEVIYANRSDVRHRRQTSRNALYDQVIAGAGVLHGAGGARRHPRHRAHQQSPAIVGGGSPTATQTQGQVVMAPPPPPPSAQATTTSSPPPAAATLSIAATLGRRRRAPAAASSFAEVKRTSAACSKGRTTTTATDVVLQIGDGDIMQCVSNQRGDPTGTFLMIQHIINVPSTAALAATRALLDALDPRTFDANGGLMMSCGASQIVQEDPLFFMHPSPNSPPPPGNPPSPPPPSPPNPPPSQCCREATLPHGSRVYRSRRRQLHHRRHARRLLSRLRRLLRVGHPVECADAHRSRHRAVCGLRGVVPVLQREHAHGTGTAQRRQRNALLLKHHEDHVHGSV